VTSGYDGCSYTAGIVGSASDVTILKCTNEAEVNARGYDVGGIVGYISNDYVLNISECKNTGTVTSDYDGSVYLGGIIGYAYYIAISECTNEADVNTSGYDVGGIVGYGNYINVDRCSNSGNITSTYTYDAYVGGIVGYSYNYNFKTKITKCQNSGIITASKYVAGVVGDICCYNDTLVINECFNTGKIISTEEGYCYVAGLVAYISGGYIQIDKCYNTGDIEAKGYELGGLFSYISADGKISNCYNTGNLHTTSTYQYGYIGGIAYEFCNNSSGLLIENVYSTASISVSESTSQYVAGFVAQIYNGVYLNNCFFDKNNASLPFSGYTSVQ